MKMSKETYETIKTDIKAVLLAVMEHSETRKNVPGLTPENLTIHGMWFLNSIVGVDRSNKDHPRHSRPDMLPRVLEFTDRSPYWIWDQDDLNDSHIDTAFRKMIPEIQEEILAAEMEKTQSPSM